MSTPSWDDIRCPQPERKPDPKDALIRELMDGRHRDLDKMREMKALIRELVAALSVIKKQWPYGVREIGNTLNNALAKDKEKGYEP